VGESFCDVMVRAIYVCIFLERAISKMEIQMGEIVNHTPGRTLYSQFNTFSGTPAMLPAGWTDDVAGKLRRARSPSRPSASTWHQIAR